MTRPQAATRLRRTLAMLPYIAARRDVTVGELARVFGVSEETIRDDLEVLPYCGLPPYTSDRLMGVVIAGDIVSLSFAEYFSRPLRLTPAEGFALLAAGRALLAVPGADPEGPLASGLAKLEDALGAHKVLDVALPELDHLEELQNATEAHEQVEIDYYSFGRDAEGTREIDPYGVISLRGQWYLKAFCHQANGDRLFRVDRIRSIRRTGRNFEPPRDVTTPADAFRASPEDTRVTLDLPATARWVAESFPVESVEERRGRLVVTLVVAARPWLERVLLAVGPGAKVRTPKEWRSVAAEAAARVLSRYDDQP